MHSVSIHLTKSTSTEYTVTLVMALECHVLHLEVQTQILLSQ